MKVDVYSTQGQKSGSVELSEEVFSYPWNADLVSGSVFAEEEHRATQQQRSAKSGVENRLKRGTGRARHGSSRSPTAPRRYNTRTSQR